MQVSKGETWRKSTLEFMNSMKSMMRRVTPGST